MGGKGRAIWKEGREGTLWCGGQLRKQGEKRQGMGASQHAARKSLVGREPTTSTYPYPYGLPFISPP